VAPCTSDDACSSAVCNLDSGECVAEQNITYATPTGSDTAACTKADPCSIAHAFATASAPRATVKLGRGSYTYSAHVVASGVRKVDGFGATWLAPADSPALSVQGSTLFSVVGVSFMSGASGAVTCTGGFLDLDRVTIDAADTPIDVQTTAGTCLTSIRRSSIRSHGSQPTIHAFGDMTIARTIIDGGGGLFMYATRFSITNSVIANQTGDAFTFSPFGESGQGSAFVSFSTIINSIISCPNVSLANSIVLNQATGAPADTLTSSSNHCSVSYSTVFPQTTPVSGTGNAVGVDPLLKDPAHGDYHLTATSPAVDTADPGATLTVDLDGTPRPQGARRDMGAFELPK
jgi:hypothetical protein